MHEKFLQESEALSLLELEKINSILEKYIGKRELLVAALRECQEVKCYLPEELIIYVAVFLKIPISEVFGVASFYSLFSLSPKGRNTIRLCTGTACYVKGVKEIDARIKKNCSISSSGLSADGRFGLEHVRCLGACSLAPVMAVNDDVHALVTPEKINGIMDLYE